MNKLGEIKRLRVSELWKHEALEFTPWLAHEDNIARLALSLGLELQVEGVEVPVGPFAADILARDASGAYVVVENQYGKTNHDHLGKVLTYAATLGATAIVWIAEQFTDEHRKAIEWLNENVSEELRLYAVEVELWQIDDSRPAVRFNVLSEPTEISKQAAAIKVSGEITDARRLQLNFWTAFRKVLLDRKVVTSAQAARPQYWFNVPLGVNMLTLSCTANTTDGKLGVRLYIRSKVASAALAVLEAEREVIERELGDRLEWNPNPSAMDKVIRLERSAAFADETQWPELIAWGVDAVDRFKRVFGPRVKAMKFPLPASLESDQQNEASQPLAS